MTSIQKTSREMMTRARLREASGRALDRAAELARMFLWLSLKYVMRPWPMVVRFLLSVPQSVIRMTGKIKILSKPCECARARGEAVV